MVYEYAIDPAAMNGFDRVARFLAECGEGSPRLIANVPRDGWARIVLETCKSLHCMPGELKRIEVLIDRAIKRKRFICRGRPFRLVDSWLEAAVAEHKRDPFRAIVSRVTNEGPPKVLGADEDLSACREWHAARTLTVERTVSGLVGALRPLLRLASSVVIVEPNFEIGQRSFAEPVRGMLGEAASCAPRLRYAAIHLSERSKRMCEHLETCADDVRRIIPHGVEAEIYLWENEIIRGPDRPSDKLHDRYLLTDRGAVSIGWGFDVKPGSYTMISLLDAETQREIEENLSPLTSRRFRLARPQPIRLIGVGGTIGPSARRSS